MYQEATRFESYNTKQKLRGKELYNSQDAVMSRTRSKGVDLVFLVKVMLESIKMRHLANVEGQERLYFNELTNQVIGLTEDI